MTEIMDLIKRFLGYTAVDTQSDENSQTVPSTAKQMNLARQLKAELEGIGYNLKVLDAKWWQNEKRELYNGVKAMGGGK